MSNGESEFGSPEWKYNQELRYADRAHEQYARFYDDTNKNTIQTGTLAARTALIINSGACIALLAFIGNLLTASDRHLESMLTALTAPLLMFACGVFLSAVGIAIVFLAARLMLISHDAKKRDFDSPYVHETKDSKFWLRFTYVVQLFAIAAVAASLAYFASGIWAMSSIIPLLGQSMP
ncbi:MAG: hypothetical protein P1V21_01090 [Rhizobiaceae bacterium]|nr:hypothetical protein [Rhizobiaceae bacterium]